MPIRLGLAIIVAGALVAGAARAQSAQQLMDTCYSPTASDDDTISTCTSLINTGQYQGTELSHLYNNRGAGYQGKGDLDPAFQDFTMAIQLDGSNAQAYKNLGNVYFARGDYPAAITQFDTAIGLKPDYAHAFRDRGQAKRKLGDLDGGQADLDMAAKLEAK